MRVKTLHHHVLIGLGVILVCACGGGDPMPDIGLTDLGNLGYPSATASDVSADGRVVVGSSRVERRVFSLFRWAKGAMTNLGSLANLNSSATVDGISTDGAVVALTDTGHAYRWTESGGKVDLGTLGGSAGANATGLSADGTTVVGYSNTPDQAQHAFRWTQDDGMGDLGTGGWHHSAATAASADGSVVVGTVGNDGVPEVISYAFRWTESGGIVSLGALGGTYSRADSVSNDGSVVVGQATTADGKSHAFRWSLTGGMVDLGTLKGDAWADYTVSWAEDVSADGKVVVGMVQNSYGQSQAFRWTEETGMQTLNDWALDSGITLPVGTTFQNAIATNSDGNIVVGSMNNGNAFLVRGGLSISDAPTHGR